MGALYLICLTGGGAAILVFAALSALGGAHFHLGSQGHVHAPLPHSPTSHGGMHAQGGGHGHAQGQTLTAGHSQSGQTGASAASPHTLESVGMWTLSWLNPLVFAAAALWFGAAGTLGTTFAAPSTFVLAAAIVAGLLGASAVRALMATLLRASTPPLQARAEGAVGVLNAAIRLDGAGEVLYTLEGLRRSLPARSVDGAPLPRGTSVVIIRRERGIAWVVPTDPLDALTPDADAPSVSST